MARTNGHRTWTTFEERTLVEMWNAGSTAKEIGAVLKRSRDSVQSRVDDNRVRLRLVPHLRSDPLKEGHARAIRREVEQAIVRAQAATGRRRSSIVREAIGYLYGEGKRRRKATILDLGGMIEKSPFSKNRAA